MFQKSGKQKMITMDNKVACPLYFFNLEQYLFIYTVFNTGSFMNVQTESNRLKQLAGSDLKNELKASFDDLIVKKMILSYQTDENFKHQGYEYPNQYLINFVLKTLDNKYILIRSTTSFRLDRYKQSAYDIGGVLKNSEISSDVVASIILVPDSELGSTSFINFRNNIQKGVTFSPASHLMVISEFYTFLENLKASVESEVDESESFIVSVVPVKDGSYYGKAGNAQEKEVVNILNDKGFLLEYKAGTCKNKIFNSVMDQLCRESLIKGDIFLISATDTVKKLRSGGNAKTDVIITIETINGQIIETISVKNSSANVVSCHDYKAEDFIRVLNVKDTKLEDYLALYQEYPTYSDFEKNMPENYSLDDFEKLFKPYKDKLTEWALTGQHDLENLIDSVRQVSRYLLIITENEVFCSDFPSYINKIYTQKKLTFGMPFAWTYPSKQRGKRIQLKMPIII